jgi:hypothetical protein
MTSNVLLRCGMAVMLAVTLSGCATADNQPSENLVTLMPDSLRWFKLTWEAVPESDGRVRLRGYVENTYGEPATRIQLLAQALDASGKVVGQKIEFMPFTLPGFGRAYYEVAGLPQADHDRVTVWSYERIQGNGGVITPR